MDMDTLTTPQTTTQRSVPENAQMQMRARVGLLRYHSAPSPVLSSFISDEDFFCESIPPQAHNSELAQLLSPVDDMCASVLHPNAMQVECSREATQYAMCPPLTTEPPLLSEAGCFNRFYVNSSAIQGARFNKSGHISSICEHIGGNPSADFHGSASANMHVDMEIKSKKLEFSMPKVAVPISTSRLCQSRLATTKSNLIRHSSFPADFTCGRAVDGSREGPAPETSGPCIQTRCLESPLSINRSSLFRQGSSPSSFLSQSSFDGTVSGCEKGLLSPSSGSSSEDDRNGKEAQYLCRMSSFWDEAGLGTTAFKQRKRERGTEDEVANGSVRPNGSCVPDSIVSFYEKIAAEEETLPWSFDDHMDTSSGGLLRIDDSVLCRARAKRGCATHPRSIAERVRRTKISEGMRKLQELVPNMEKQTNTATMLDEAVEYVKFLQQEVQKLSENQAKCNGMCQSKGST